MTEPTLSPEPADTDRHRVPSLSRCLNGALAGPLVRCGLISVLTLLLLIPLSFVENIVRDRSYLHREATSNIAQSWGGSQTISGPLLVIPYEIWKERKEVVSRVVKGKEQLQEVVQREYETRHKLVLPQELRFDVKLDPEVRYRGIYKLALYNAPVAVDGNFTLPRPEDFHKNLHKVHWEKAWVSIGITDLKTISEESALNWNGAAAAAYKPGTKVNNLLGQGFHTAVPVNAEAAGTKRAFSIKLKVRGSGGIAFTPVGEKTDITMAGTWAAPSFQGNLLPAERTIRDNGFSARWAVSNLTRAYPQMGDLESSDFYRMKNNDSDYHRLRSSDSSAIVNFTAGVDLHEPVSLYRMITRAVMYGILFISLSFTALFVFELASKQRMHLVQYGMVGLSMSLFYLILLSLAEHISFEFAFGAATLVTVSMNALYVGAVLRSKKQGFSMGALLAGLYALLFSLLRMEDVALLVGTGLVVTMMGVLMFVTRRLGGAKAS